MADTARTRLEPLLDWVNDPNRTAISASAVHQRLAAFVRSFDGPVRAHHVEMRPERWPKPSLRDDEGRRLTKLEWLAMQFQAALSWQGEFTPTELSFTFERDDDGLNELLVSGPLPEVALYLVVRLVVDEAVRVRVCEAPAPSRSGVPNDWLHVCGKLFVVGDSGRGRPRGNTCSDACKTRMKNKNYQRHLQQQQRARRRLRVATGGQR
jgi:hypothetical protein